MSPERFRQIGDLFDDILAVTPDQRAAFLRDRCGADASLRAEVESLLEAETSAQARLEGAVAEAAAALPADQPDNDAGLRLGPYLLIRQIGNGGMGVVWQAIRSDGEYLQTVAVKLVCRGMDTDIIVRRFRAERQILAALSHPNIAALLDGGTSPDGRPYLVMEYLDGEGLLEYVQRRQLSTRARIELFLPLCRAVQAAHRIGILHRDVKPGNVMVTRDGIPKLLDFGIAKLLLPELVSGESPRTQTETRLLTPDYASPEQIRGEELTPASDVYSLGVLLYQLLTGSRPYSITGRSMASIVEAIDEQRFALPSKTVKDTRLRSELAGDIDNIISMAMRREPERRYSSTAELEADLDHFLKGLPVQARRDSIVYRASRWTRRNALTVTAGASVSAAAALGAAWWGAKSRQVPAEVLELCRRADALLKFDIRSTHPGEGLPAPLTQSIALWQEATRRAPDYLPAWTGLADAAEFAIDYDSARAAELTRLADSAASRALRLDPRSASAHAVRGSLRFREWRFMEAAGEFARSLEFNPQQPWVLADLAGCLSLTGKLRKAIQTVEQWLQKYATSSGGSSPSASVQAQVVVLSSLASLYRTTGDFERGRETARRAIRLQSNYVPARLQLGMIEQQTGNFEAAAREYRTAYEMRPGDQRSSAALGHLYAVTGRPAESREMISHLNKLRDEGLRVSGSLALIAAGFGDSDLALTLLEEAERAHEPGLPFRLIDWRMQPILAHDRVTAMARRLALAE